MFSFSLLSETTDIEDVLLLEHQVVVVVYSVLGVEQHIRLLHLASNSLAGDRRYFDPETLSAKVNASEKSGIRKSHPDLDVVAGLNEGQLLLLGIWKVFGCSRWASGALIKLASLFMS